MSPIHHLPPDASANQLENYLNGKFNVLTTIVIDTGNDIGDLGLLRDARDPFNPARFKSLLQRLEQFRVFAQFQTK